MPKWVPLHSAFLGLAIWLLGGCHGERFGRFEDRAPSADPPGRLGVEQVPLFVAIGWDDNGVAEGMTWSLELFRGRRNPPGVGRVETYDGAPISATYFNTSAYTAAAGTLWAEAFRLGHEIGNHTDTHATTLERSNDLELWLREMRTCQDALTGPVGIPPQLVTGFRTPFLGTSDATLRAVEMMGFFYDASLEEGFQRGQDGTDFFWPYTLDAGSPGNEFFAHTGDKEPLKEYPGLWEMPAYAVIVPPDSEAERYGIAPGLRSRLAKLRDYFDVEQGKLTGFDYNLWIEFELTVPEVIASLKYTLDQRLRGNRAPMLFGAHTHLYTGGSAFRRAAIEEFLRYALSKPDVRVVGIRKVLDWVRDPTPLDEPVSF